MAKLDRVLRLVHLLHDRTEGMTLDEMAAELDVTRRTAERLRDVVALNFDLDEWVEERVKRFRIRESLRRAYTRPTAPEVAALAAEAEARAAEGAPRAVQLASLLAKVKGAMDDRELRRIDADLDALARVQRTMVTAGPGPGAPPDALATVQGAILAGLALEFEYRAEDTNEARWRRVIPYGLVHGATTYVVGKMPRGDRPPVYYRLDRMEAVRASGLRGAPPADWDLDAWLRESFGVWREDRQDIVLRVLPGGVARALSWRFHPTQSVEPDGDGLLVRFRAGGLREIADHVFTWGGEVVIEAPDALRAVMRERLAAAAASCDRI